MIKILNLTTHLAPFLKFPSQLENTVIESLIEMGDHIQFMEGKVGSDNEGGQEDTSIRNSQVSFIQREQNTDWMFNKFAEITSVINSEHYQFDLDHISAFQYTTYKEGGFYDWHIDADFKRCFGPNHRKLGFSLLLSDPSEFTGGEFEIIPGGNPNIPVKIENLQQGDLLVFPSFTPHRVAPITSGKRKSLVWWVEGPKFK